MKTFKEYIKEAKLPEDFFDYMILDLNEAVSWLTYADIKSKTLGLEKYRIGKLNTELMGLINKIYKDNKTKKDLGESIKPEVNEAKLLEHSFDNMILDLNKAVSCISNAEQKARTLGLEKYRLGKLSTSFKGLINRMHKDNDAKKVG